MQTFIEVLNDLGLQEGKHYRIIGRYAGNTLSIIFLENNSVINFLPMDVTRDRDSKKLKSIPATAVGVDEVDSVAKQLFTDLASRAGRKNRNGAPDITIATCNPNEGWVKEHVYRPHREGTLPEGTAVIEFEMQDSFLYDEGYYDGFLTNPEQWKQRYLYNDWDYLDDEDSLFKSRVLDSIHTPNYSEDWTDYLGADHARGGKDRSVFANIKHNEGVSVLVDLELTTRDDLVRLALPEEKENIPWSAVLGRKLIRYMDSRSIGYEHTGVDALPAGLIDYMRAEKRPVYEYLPGAASKPRKPTPNEERKGIKPKPLYDMIRSEGADLLRQDMEAGKFFFWDGCPHLSELKQELLWHGFTVKDKQLCVEKKDQIKKRLGGKSPDYADALFIAYWMTKQKASVGSYGRSDVSDKSDSTITGGMLESTF